MLGALQDNSELDVALQTLAYALSAKDAAGARTRQDAAGPRLGFARRVLRALLGNTTADAGDSALVLVLHAHRSHAMLGRTTAGVLARRRVHVSLVFRVCLGSTTTHVGQPPLVDAPRAPPVPPDFTAVDARGPRLGRVWPAPRALLEST